MSLVVVIAVVVVVIVVAAAVVMVDVAKRKEKLVKWRAPYNGAPQTKEAEVDTTRCRCTSKRTACEKRRHKATTLSRTLWRTRHAEECSLVHGMTPCTNNAACHVPIRRVATGRSPPPPEAKAEENKTVRRVATGSSPSPPEAKVKKVVGTTSGDRQ